MNETRPLQPIVADDDRGDGGASVAVQRPAAAGELEAALRHAEKLMDRWSAGSDSRFYYWQGRRDALREIIAMERRSSPGGSVKAEARREPSVDGARYEWTACT